MNTRKQTRTLLHVMAALIFGHGLLEAQALTTIETNKRAQTGLKYLAVGSSAHMTGMAEASTALQGTASALFYNPAGIANLTSFAEVDLGTTTWIADIKHNNVSAVVHPWNGDYGSFGIFLQNVDYGEIQGTIRANNDQGFIDIGTYNPGGSAFGIGYAIPLTTQFAVGGTIKLARQNLGDGVVAALYSPGSNGKDSTVSSSTSEKFKTEVVAFDFGVLYATNIKSLTFGMAVRNFSKEVKYIREGFQLPLTLRIGLAMNLLDVFDMDRSSQSLMMAVDAEHPRDYSEQIRVGLEYQFMQILSIRFGYVTPADGQDVSYGLGVSPTIAGTKLAVDYSYTPFEVFDGVSRISLRFSY